METKKYNVSLTRYPEEFEVEATSESEAIEMAKKKAGFTVWESEVEEIEEEKTTIENLKLSIVSGEATAETFEEAIKKEGLTMEMISLIKTYYTDSDYSESAPIKSEDSN